MLRTAKTKVTALPVTRTSIGHVGCFDNPQGKKPVYLTKKAS